MCLHKSVQIALMLTVLVCVSVEARTHSKGKKKTHFQNKENEEDENPIANTENGQVRGTRNQTVDLHKTYYAFKGIPFGKPPINDLRFEPPQPAEKWDGIYKATNDSILCVQSAIPFTGLVGQEDCLYLNVYTPNLPTTSKNNNSNNDNLLAVMVFIYGGGFRNGNTSSLAYGPDFLIDRDIIVVNINYRLGILGFISTNDLVAPGNVGLKDQNLALKWVQNNIENFNGDPKKITIFGESAGAASVSYQYQSPKSKGLFRGAIMQSGTTLCSWSLSRHIAQVTTTVGQILGANISSTKSLIENLKKVDLARLQDVATVVELGELLIDGFFNGLVFAPVIEPDHEGAFFTWKSHQQLSEGKFNRVPAIIGFNSQEGNYVHFSLPVQIYLAAYNLNVSNLVPDDMNVNNLTIKSALGAKVKKHYFGLSNAVGADKRNSTIYVSDTLFNRPIRETVAQASKHVPIYFYRFSYIGLFATGYERSAPGVEHAEELNYLWYRNNTLSAPKDLEVSRKFVDLWTNFVKYNNPTPKKDESLDNVIWPEARQNATQDSLIFIDIDYNLTISKNPQKENIDFWNELYRDYGNPPYSTY